MMQTNDRLPGALHTCVVRHVLEADAMSTKRMVAIVVVVLIGAAFLVGYLPERRQRAAAEAELERVRSSLLAAQGRVRTSELLGRILMVKEVTARQDYGHAQELSSAFFDAVRAEASMTHAAQLGSGLNQILAKRDIVTAALARADAGAVDIVHTIELQLRQLLGYSVPAEPVSK
jgi:hypothetical protein